LLAIPTLLVDYSNAVLQYPDPFSMTTMRPIEHIAVWKSLAAGLSGQQLQASHAVGSAEESKLLTAFPDLIVARVYQVAAGRSKAAAEFLILLYVSALGFTIYRLWASVRKLESQTVGEDEIYEPKVFQEKANAH
jgi:hypothetical protein